MSRHFCAALAAAMLVAAAPAPAAAGERATLRVTARVVDRCTVEVPFRVPPWVWRDRRHQPWRFVHHDCRDKPWIHAKEVLLERLRARFERFDDWLDDRRAQQAQWHDHGARLREARHPSRRNVVLITITY